MYLLTANQTKAAEKAANNSGLPFASMMEQAGTQIALLLLNNYRESCQGQVVILAGNGNNGGDGFVAARLLAEQGVSVCVILTSGATISDCAFSKFEWLSRMNIRVVDWQEQPAFARRLIKEATLFVDCVFGTGFHGHLPPAVRELFRLVGRTDMPVVGVDLPSGVCADTGVVAEDTLRCDTTLAFYTYKYAHVLYPAKDFCGDVIVADIGIPQPKNGAFAFIVDEEYVKAKLAYTQGNTHKGTFGTAGLLVGSKGMSGAATFAVCACLRCGVGLAKPIVPDSIYPLVATVAPEGVYSVYDQTVEAGQVVQMCMNTDALLVGCGLSVNSFTKSVCRELVRSYPGPLVLDADGINSILPHIDVLKEREGITVLTPHPGEMARLLNLDIASVQADRFGVAAGLAKEYGVYIVLKGAGTVLASPDGSLAINLTGNSGLSKGGSGDVLAGMIVSLLAQGMLPFEAVCSAAWLHGTAGDMTAHQKSRRGMLPTDVVKMLPSLFLTLEQ